MEQIQKTSEEEEEDREGREMKLKWLKMKTSKEIQCLEDRGRANRERKTNRGDTEKWRGGRGRGREAR